MRKTFGWLLGVAVAAGLAVPVGVYGVSAATTKNGSKVTVALGAVRSLPPGYFGINYDYGGASVYATDSHVAQQLAALEPSTLRWPAGTGANYFQWQKGYPVAVSSGGRGKCAPPSERETNSFRFTLADLAAAYRRSGATPIFDLNVMSATLADQIEMLKTAQRVDKLPVKYVELGNEFYLCNTDYVRAFPTARDYGVTVAGDVRALHKAFPGVRVAAVGSSGSRQPREAGWNAGVLDVATGAGKPDAITLHIHPEYNKSLTTSGLPTLFTLPYTSAVDVAAATKEFPGTPAWITEYGLSLHWNKGNPAQLTYANALFESEAAILLAQTVHAATLVDYWSAFGPALNYAYTGKGRTAVGLAMTWLDQAARDARTEAPLVFSNGPMLGATGDSALVGEVFMHGSKRKELLVNLSGGPVTLPSGLAIQAGAPYQQVTGKPTERVTTAGQLATTHGTVGRSVTLAPYSITLVG